MNFKKNQLFPFWKQLPAIKEKGQKTLPAMLAAITNQQLEKRGQACVIASFLPILLSKFINDVFKRERCNCASLDPFPLLHFYKKNTLLLNSFEGGYMLSQCIGEFLGTLMLIILGDGVVAGALLCDSKAFKSGWMTITTGWFIAVVMGVFVAQFAGSINADINPAVSFAKYWMQIYPFKQTFYFMLAQLAGAFVGACIVWVAYLPHWSRTENKDHKLMVFCTKPAILNYPANFICEVIATATFAMPPY